jgi:hypothetical protein
LSQVDKDKWVANVLKTQKGQNLSGIVENTLQSGLVNPFKKFIGKPVGAAYNYAIDPWISLGNAGLTEGAKFITDANKYDGKGLDWERFKKNALTKKYRAMDEDLTTGNETLDTIASLGTEILFDPTTYLTMGASVSSKAGRLALSNRMIPLISKYPELKPLLGNIARYGPTEIPRHIREAEGIFTGVKWFGQEVAYSDGLAKAWRYTGGAARANLGDIVYSSKYGGMLERAITSKSLRPAVDSGIFRSGAMNSFDEKWFVPLAERSAGIGSRGHEQWMRNTIGSAAEPHLDAYSALEAVGDPSFNSIVHAIESPTVRAGLSGPAALVADQYRLWEDTARVNYGDAVQRLASTRNLNINELSMLDDHIYHQLTPAAKEDMFGVKGTLKKFFNLTERDIVEGAGTMQFRKYTKGELFLGVELKEGSIAEINKIYGDFLEAKGLPRAKFFEDDLRTITQGYASSVARAHGRLRFVERMFDYGPDVIKPLLVKEVIPDATLLASMKDDISRLGRVRDLIAKRVNAGTVTSKVREGTAKELREVMGILTKSLDGGYMLKAASDAELMKLADELEAIIAKQEAARTFAMTLTAEQRGAWAEAHAGLIAEAHNLREAIIAGTSERYGAGKRLKQMYHMHFPDSDGSELVGKTGEWIAERLERALNGGKALANHEVSGLLWNKDRIVAQLAEIPKTSENVSKLSWLQDRLDVIDEQLFAHETLDGVREVASYSDKGVLFGFAPVAGEPMPFQMWTTHAPYDDAGAFRQMDDALMRHAVPEEELIDFRTTDHMLSIVDDPSTIYEFGYAWGKVGIPDLTWNSVVDDAFETGQVDDLMWQANPEKAMLLDGILQFQEVVNQAVEEGVDLTDRQVSEFFNMIKEANYNVIAAMDAPNAEAVSRTVINDWFGELINVADQEGFSGLLVPAKSVFDDSPNDAWAVLQHKSNTIGEVGTAFDDELQFVKDNKMASHLLDDTAEMSRISLMDNADELAQQGVDVEAIQQARRGLEDQLFGVENLLEVKKLQNKLINNMVVVDGQPIPMEIAKSQMAKIEGKVQAAYDAIDAEVLATTERIHGVEAIEASAMDITTRQLVAWDNAKAIMDWTPELEQKLVDELATFTLHLQNIPSSGAGANEAWVKNSQKLLANSELIGDPAVRDAYDRVVKLALADEVSLAKIDSELVEMNLEAAMVSMGWVDGTFMYDVADKGWTALRQLGVQMPDEVLERWKPNLAKLQDPGEFAEFRKAIGRVQGYWKKYVTNTMGFLVRNGYSGTYMNYADGVTSAHIIEGTKWASVQGPVMRNEKNWRKAGNSWGKWMEEAGIDMSNPAAVAEANKVMEIVYATSRGVNADNPMPVVERWKVTKLLDKNKQTAKWRLGDNPYLNLFTSKNDFVERALRIPMALDSVRQGHTVDEAVARISRVHFDYTDLSALDEAAKKAIPFWIWTSRNVPLQITQMMSRPKAYYEYNKVQQAFPVVEDDPTTDEVEGMVVPKWMRPYGPLQIGAGSLLTPDLPHLRMKQQIGNLLNPIKLIGQTTPLVRVPIEVFVSKRQLGLDVGTFKKTADVNGYEKYIWQLLRDLKMYGLIDRDEETGDFLMHAGVSYAIEQAAVPLQQINRLTGGRSGGKANLNERWASSVWNWFGIPYRGVGPQQAESELVGRNYAVDELEKKLEKKLRIEKDYSSTP